MHPFRPGARRTPAGGGLGLGVAQKSRVRGKIGSDVHPRFGIRQRTAWHDALTALTACHRIQLAETYEASET